MDLSKEQVRALLLQVASLLKIFGYVHPKLKKVGEFIEVMCRPEVFDSIWAIFESNPELLARIRSVQDVGVAGILSVFEEIGNTSGDIRPAAKSPEYYKFRQGVMGIVMMAQVWAMFTASLKDDEYVGFASRLINQNFDEAWAIDHPNDI